MLQEKSEKLTFEESLQKFTRLLFQTDVMLATWKIARTRLKDLGLEAQDISVHAGEITATVIVKWTVEGSQFNEKMSLKVSSDRAALPVPSTRYFDDFVDIQQKLEVFYLKNRALVMAFVAKGFTVETSATPCKHGGSELDDDVHIKVVLAENAFENIVAYLEFVDCRQVFGGER